MKRGRPRLSLPQHASAFAGFRFPPEVILLAVRWYLRYGLSYRDLEGRLRISHSIAAATGLEYSLLRNWMICSASAGSTRRPQA